MSPVMPTGAVLDGQPPAHPAAHPGLTARTITVGSASKELRMIGWRVGWVTGPEQIMADIGLVGLTNVVSQVGIAQQAVAAALRVHPGPARGLSVRPAARGLVAPDRHRAAGFHPGAGIAATVHPVPGRRDPDDRMGSWRRQVLRLVFANEPVSRLGDLGARFDNALR
jgi:hypothetical protein